MSNPFIQYTKTVSDDDPFWDTFIQLGLQVGIQKNLDKILGQPFSNDIRITSFGGRGFEVILGPFTVQVVLKVLDGVLAIQPRLIVASYGASKSSESNLFMTSATIGWSLLAGIEEFCTSVGFVESLVPIEGGLEGV